AFCSHDLAAPAISTLSLHDALPISLAAVFGFLLVVFRRPIAAAGFALVGAEPGVTAVAHDYFSIRILEAPFYLMTLALTALMRRSEEHTSELQSRENLVCRLLLEKK